VVSSVESTVNVRGCRYERLTSLAEEIFQILPTDSVRQLNLSLVSHSSERCVSQTYIGDVELTAAGSTSTSTTATAGAAALLHAITASSLEVTAAVSAATETTAGCRSREARFSLAILGSECVSYSRRARPNVVERKQGGFNLPRERRPIYPSGSGLKAC